ncbi:MULTISPECIES: helix-turn-helix domain-containing protein [unclassified Streptomyces]|uniref:winged helix-turn-helix transcriptional regulator n=1 Tax=unclassified Streptomyces TaxID=2593676 RepID=UPI0001C1ABC4|nr:MULTISPECIES: helix-turn-helix domain-containing protein [unclassified Streptomyces]AEN11206.1 transcriptional regulator, HxlR family [Streptomyces sp. SirexAA-E]MYR65769.1 transcriptional regulator [Streptomyces sp. SID4939]MYR98746.1 transcriptional regulator [Streptomyces sp. SID4940]MYT63531.1 transcriptional regulator [Streptomyces sp. SID8357]MYT85781.1 transcriptional regulator [Streptomyces sp. SID8360]
MPRTTTRVPKPDWTDPDCPVARTLDLVGDRWSLLVIRDAMDGARSFTEFQRRTGIARNILTERLRKLTAYGLLAQRTAPSGRRQEYVLTDAGRDLFPVILTLRQWGERHAFAPGEAHSTLVDEHGTPVPDIVPTSADGNPLDTDTTHVQKIR